MSTESQQVVFNHLEKVKEEAKRKYALAALAAIFNGHYEEYDRGEAIRRVVEQDLDKAREEKKAGEATLYYAEEQQERYDAYCEICEEQGIFPYKLIYLL